MTHPKRLPRAVVDPNVYVAALIRPDGVCGRLLGAINDDRLAAIACPRLLEELSEVLLRPKFRRWFTAEGALAYWRAVRARAEVEPDPPHGVPRTRDPADDYLVELAIVTSADAIISGDPDLAAELLPSQVWTPKDALDRIG